MGLFSSSNSGASGLTAQEAVRNGLKPGAAARYVALVDTAHEAYGTDPAGHQSASDAAGDMLDDPKNWQ